MLKILFSIFTKQATLMRRSTVLSLPPQLLFPASAALSAQLEISGLHYKNMILNDDHHE